MFEGFLSNPKTYKDLEQDFESVFVSLLEKERLDKKDFKIPYYNPLRQWQIVHGWKTHILRKKFSDQ